MFAPRPKPRFRPYQGESGIGGLLVLFIVTQATAILFSIVQSPTIIAGFRPDSWALGERASLYRPLLLFEALGQGARLVCMVFGLVLLLRRRPSTPRFYQIFLAAAIVFGLVDAVGVWATYGQLLPLIAQSGQPANLVESAREQSVVSALRMAGYAGIWFLYWRGSERVHRTFGASSSS